MSQPASRNRSIFDWKWFSDVEARSAISWASPNVIANMERESDSGLRILSHSAICGVKPKATTTDAAIIFVNGFCIHFEVVQARKLHPKMARKFWSKAILSKQGWLARKSSKPRAGSLYAVIMQFCGSFAILKIMLVVKRRWPANIFHDRIGALDASI